MAAASASPMGSSCIRLRELVPPEKYFATHPEYFSLVNGKRQDGYAQLCCTNEDVIRICTEEIRAAMRAQPDATVFSVSQNDTDKHCQCPRCQALAKQEDSQGAPVLYLVNRVAEAVQKEFPGKAVETLAYQWSRRPPKKMRPQPNVIVRLCSIECCFSHPLATCDSRANRTFRADLAAWSKVSQRLWVWDYATDFANYLLPFPNQRVRRPNIRFYVANHVKGIFEQDTYETPHSELAALGGYLTAKFLWDPDYDQDRAMNEFLAGYYGKAAGPVCQYIDLLHDKVEHENLHVHIYDPPTRPYLDDGLLRQANALWEEAEKCAAAAAQRVGGRAAACEDLADERRLRHRRTGPRRADAPCRFAHSPAAGSRTGRGPVPSLHANAQAKRHDTSARRATVGFPTVSGVAGEDAGSPAVIL